MFDVYKIMIYDHLLLTEVLKVLLQVGFRRSQVPDEDLGTRKTNLQQPYRGVAEKERNKINS